MFLEEEQELFYQEIQLEPLDMGKKVENYQKVRMNANHENSNTASTALFVNQENMTSWKVIFFKKKLLRKPCKKEV